MQETEGRIAFRGALRNASRCYPGRDDDRCRDGMLLPEVTPSFAIAASESVFTIGSCFARNVEDALLRRGLTVPTAGFTAPQEEAPGRPNRILNQYNPGTMLQCLTALDTGETGAGLYDLGEDQVVDCLLATGSRPVTAARALERRAQIRELYRSGLEAAGVVVVTLGLVESWYDREDGLYLNEAPTRRLINGDNERFTFRQLGYPECSRMLADMLDRLSDGGRRRVILTVSPVPLRVTFAGGDAVLRNAYSKAILRAVAEEAARSRADVDYFPSYEMVLSMGLQAFGDDNLHVRPMVVDRVIAHMVSRYLSPGTTADGSAEDSVEDAARNTEKGAA